MPSVDNANSGTLLYVVERKIECCSEINFVNASTVINKQTILFELVIECYMKFCYSIIIPEPNFKIISSQQSF